MTAHVIRQQFAQIIKERSRVRVEKAGLERDFFARTSTSVRIMIRVIRKQLAQIRTAPSFVGVLKAGRETDFLATTLMNVSYPEYANLLNIVETQTDRFSACAVATMLAVGTIAKVK